MNESARRGAPDASMELLNSILRDTIDPDYATHSAVERSRGRASWLVLVICLLAGLMVTTSALGTGHGNPGVAAERADLVARIQVAEQRNKELRAKAVTVATEVKQLETQYAGAVRPDPNVAIWSGNIAVTGPGVLLVIHDNPSSNQGIIVDQDVRQVINGLWLAGAEAISINGQRLSARTAIRQAGAAVTVGFRSMTTPYQIAAIGDSRQLVANFEANSGGAWLGFLRRNYGVNWTIEQQSEIKMDADAALRVNQAAVR